MLDVPARLVVAGAAGALLNLTPCVLPVVPVKIRTIILHPGESRPHRIAAATAFLSGTLLFFLALGVASTALHGTWGVLFQSRVTLVLLVSVLAATGIMTFFDIALPLSEIVYRVGGGRFFEPFSSGALAAILATPCTGPFLGGILAVSLTQPLMAVVAVFLSIGIGLALPYVILLLRPKLLEKLPRGGEWARRVHQALAFLLLAGAVFFAQGLLPSPLGNWLWRIWAFLLVGWAVLVAVRGKSLAGRSVAAGFAVIAIALAYTGGLLAHASPGPLDWQPFSAKGPAAARHERRPVLIEFTAAWCINCKILERTVYRSPAVAAAAHGADILPLKADLTMPNRDLDKRLVEYGGAGLPFAAVLDGRGAIIRQFSGLFTADALIDAIKLAGKDQLKPGQA
ncbi:protein-disulfide reductase DsbD [Acidiphilium sp.]|uniref:protein-disulfide reductase DsbD family protein n=1 Tax=Acidiphilium sp. TaxID=527 RepID=UPI002585EA6E|nr:thioredoxin family protein [Acidiphilium sp.]